MRKDEHLKIVAEFEKEIKTLQTRIAELSAEINKLELNLKVKQFQCDRKGDIINDMLSKNIQNLNYMIEYDKKMKEYYNQTTKQIKEDNEKFDELVNYIKSNFSHALMQSDIESESQNISTSNDEKLSKTFVGENGQVYMPYHVVDLAIMIMKTQKKKLKEILGDEDFNINNSEE